MSDPTVTIAAGLSVDPPPFLALVQISAVIKNTSGGPVSAAWTLRAMTATGLRSLTGADLGAVPGSAIVTPIVPRTLAAGTSDIFQVSCLAQFPDALSGAQFAFVASTPGALQVVGPVLIQTLNGAFRPTATYPLGPGDPLPALDPTNPMVLLPAPAPTSYPIPLVDWA